MIWLDAIEQAQAIRRKEVSSLELTREYLERIDRLDPSLRSFVAVDTDTALAAAERADVQVLHDQEGVGPLQGVPMSVKDVIDVAGLATTHSSKALERNVSRIDDPLVQRFRQAGLVVLGKTNVPEFCTSMTDSELNGICRNPWDLDRTPGGSSGGAAAALAAGLCSLSHGTDGAGSVRIPAAFCGLVGVKPTRGLISYGPESGPAYFGTSGPGVLTHSVRDAAAMLDVMVGTGHSAPAWSPGATHSYGAESMHHPEGLRIAVSHDPALRHDRQRVRRRRGGHRPCPRGLGAPCRVCYSELGCDPPSCLRTDGGPWGVRTARPGELRPGGTTQSSDDREAEPPSPSPSMLGGWSSPGNARSSS